MSKVTGSTSDGYHTFDELYEFRMLYNAAFFNQLMSTDIPVAKSRLHSDGEVPFGGGWFIVHAHLPTGDITNHYELKDWDLFKVTEIDRAPEWDGHTAQDVAVRLRQYIEGVTTWLPPTKEVPTDLSNPPSTPNHKGGNNDE